MEDIYTRTAMLLGPDAPEKLKNAHVAVVGLGGVGSWCAQALWRTGVGKLTLLDFDRVAPSNLNRQSEAVLETLGQFKTDALAAQLRGIDQGRTLRLLPVRCDGAGRGALFAERPDFIADCIDHVPDKTALIAEALALGVPVVSAMGAGGKTDASLLRLDDISKTNTCPLARAMRRALRERGVTHVPVVWSPEEPVPGAPKPGSVMWVTATAGLLMAQKIVLTLLDTPKG